MKRKFNEPGVASQNCDIGPVRNRGSERFKRPLFRFWQVVSRIYGTIVLAHFVVKVRCRASAGCSDVAEDVTLGHPLAVSDRKTRKVTEARGQTVPMVDDDQ